MIDESKHFQHVSITIGCAFVVLATCFAFCLSAAVPSAHAATKGALIVGKPAAARGNCDAFIGLGKDRLVLAAAKKTVVVRKGKSSKAGKLGQFTKLNCVVVETSKMSKGVNYSWVPVKIPGVAIGYVPFKEVRLMSIDIKTFGMDLSKPENVRRAKACRYGIPYIGLRWSSKTNSLKAGMNCNMYAGRCLRQAGVNIPAKKSTLENLSKLGKAIKRSELKPGDLIGYSVKKAPSKGKKDTRKVNHVAIYIGSGLLINSSGRQGTKYPTGGIRISMLDYRTPAPFVFRSIIK